MAGSKKRKTSQFLSPENYIRHRARLLPVKECLVNSEWEKSRMANIIIARVHSNGNITLCIYLVDLLCLGVKDTTWSFNISKGDYKDLITEVDERMELEPIEYILAHNMIFAALEFAEDYGFYPHEDFTSVTQFILEKDTDDIEIIDVECGMDGKPAYIRTPNHSENEASGIIATLEKNAGPGNYLVLYGNDSNP